MKILIPTSAVLVLMLTSATPIFAQTQNIPAQVAPTIISLDIAALQAACTRNRAFDCRAAVQAAFAAYVLQNPTAKQINAQIGLVAAALISAYNTDTGLFRMRFALTALANYSTDANQINSLGQIDVLMAEEQPVSLTAFASAISPN